MTIHPRSSLSNVLLPDLLRESLRNGQTPMLTVTSGSMRPLLQPGDQVLLAQAVLPQLQPGDIVVVADADGLLTHRLWCLGATAVVTRGDRSLLFDPPWPASQLVGQVVVRRRQGRELGLQTGSGGWLNRRLARLAAWETSFFIGSGKLIEPQDVARLNHLATIKQKKRSVRLMRRLLLWGQQGLVWLVTAVAGWGVILEKTR